MRDPNIRAQIEFTGSYGTKRLTITDAASHLHIVEIELTPEMLMEMLSNTTVGGIEGVPAWFAPQPEQIGKTHVHVSRTYRPDFQPSDGQMTEWLETVKRHVDGTTASFQRHNQNRLSVIIRHYLAPEQAPAWQESAQQWLDAQLVTAPGYGTPASSD